MTTGKKFKHLDDSKIVKKGVRGISVKIYPENE